MATLQRRFLVGSRWTAEAPLAASEGERHFEVIAVSGRGARIELTLRAVLTRRDYRVPLAALSDPEAWTRGWRSILPHGA